MESSCYNTYYIIFNVNCYFYTETKSQHVSSSVIYDAFHNPEQLHVQDLLWLNMYMCISYNKVCCSLSITCIYFFQTEQSDLSAEHKEVQPAAVSDLDSD